MTSLTGKVAIVTGAGSGIGLAVARSFIAEGAAVLLADISEEGRARANDLGDRAAFFRVDVTQSSEWATLVSEARSRFGPVSILVNNAGISDFASIEECTEAHFRHVVDVNQLSVFLGMKAVVEDMREAGGGSIINTSSTAGLVGVAGSISYVASKFAVTGMSKAAALDLAKYGIRVNSVHPGVVATPMMAFALSEGMNAAAFLKSLPISRPADPDELAAIYSFLASGAASFCTGASFIVDGGLTAS